MDPSFRWGDEKVGWGGGTGERAMTLFCAAPDPAAGVASNLSYYLDCQARALGENGFQALAGGPLGMSLLSGLITIFIALIGYRLILGETPNLRDGIGWTLRLGFVLALVTSWPAFQTLVYRVAVDGPSEVAAIVLPASGLPVDGLDGRVQQAYDTIRLGSAYQLAQNPVAVPVPTNPDAQPQIQVIPQPFQFQPPMPQTASLFVLSTTGFIGAFRIAIGFLLAVAPLAILCLLFDATLGIFAGWVRALTGMVFAGLAALIVTALDLMVVETELAHLQAMRASGLPQVIDPQGLTTIVIVFAVIMLVSSWAAVRMTAAFAPFRAMTARISGLDRRSIDALRIAAPVVQPSQQLITAHERSFTQTRAAAVADALAASMRREQATFVDASHNGGSSRAGTSRAPANDAVTPGGVGLGAVGRRMVARRTRVAARRDKSGA
jgi:type IV secretion system protein VirB6